MIIGLYAGMLLSFILLTAAIANLLTGKIFKSSSIILILLYFPAAYFSGISFELIISSLFAAMLVMAFTIVVSALLANAIPMNIIYFIGSITPWVGTGKPLLYFLLTTVIITSLFSLFTLFFSKSTATKTKSSPVGFSAALAALFYSPFAIQGMTATGFF